MQLLQQQVKPSPFNRNHLIRDAIGAALYDAMGADPAIHLFGEGAHVKMHYDASQIEREFADRVRTLPISEDGNVNFAVGTSLLGVKPVVDIITADFLYRAMDSICNTAAKLNFVLPDSEPPRTIVIRAEFLIGGPTTGQRPEALFCHIPGLNVVVPSTPRDAYGLMRTALVTPGVTIFFEDRMIPDSEFAGEDLEYSGPVPLGVGRLRQMGGKGTVTVLSYGLARPFMEKALRDWRMDIDLSIKLSADLIDLRSLYPIDWGMIKFYLARNGNLLIIEPDVQYGGIGAEIAATIAEELPHVRIKRLGARRVTIPANRALHETMLPTELEIVNAINSFN